MQDALETPFSRWIWNPIQQFHVISNLPCWHVWLQNVWGIKSLYNVVAICSCLVAKFVLFRSRGLLVGVSLPLGLLLWRHEAWKGLSDEPPVIMNYPVFSKKEELKKPRILKITGYWLIDLFIFLHLIENSCYFGIV